MSEKTHLTTFHDECDMTSSHIQSSDCVIDHYNTCEV